MSDGKKGGGKDAGGGAAERPKPPEPKPVRDEYREDRKDPDSLYKGGKPGGDRPPTK